MARLLGAGSFKDHLTGIRRIIIQDPIALTNWIIIKEEFIKGEPRRLQVKFNLENQKYEEAIQDTLQFWISENNETNVTIPKFVQIIRDQGLQNLASKIEEAFLPMTERDTGLALARQQHSSISIFRVLGENRISIDIPVLEAILSEVGDKPLAIYSINGKQRSGKSFMLNLFLKYLEFGKTHPKNWIEQTLDNKFKWQGGINRVTTGIQIWSKPYFIDVGRREVAVILMDTQGLFDQVTNMLDNARIFAYSILLSSVTIFNVQGVGEDILQFLHTFLEYAKLGEIKVDQAFQKLIMLIRDWANFRSYNWGYHDNDICPVNSQGERNNLKRYYFDKNAEMSSQAKATREKIKACFHQVGVVALPDPGDSVRYDDNDSPGTWNSDFKKQAKDFVELMFTDQNINDNVKRIGNQELSGEMLKGYVGKWADIYCNSSEIPALNTIVEATAEVQNKANIKVATGYYDAEMDKLVNAYLSGMQISVFESNHNRILNASLSKFTSTKGIGGQAVQEKYVSQLKSDIEARRVHYNQLNTNNLNAATALEKEKEQKRLAQQRADEEKLAKEAAQRRAVAAAELNLAEAQRAVTAANARLQSIIQNRESFHDFTTVQTKHRRRVGGIVGSPYYTSEVVKTFNDAKFNQAVSEAKAEVDTAEQWVRKAEEALEQARATN